MITWAGTCSDDLGVIVEHYPKVQIPRRKIEVVQIPGRNGDAIIEQDAFENYEMQYEVFLDAKCKGGLEEVIPKLSDWLLGNTGYQKLEDSYFPGFYRMAYVIGGYEFVSFFNEYGEGTLTFNCAPEKYYKLGSDEITLTNGQILTNPSNFTAKPIIKFDLDTISGSGHISVSPTSGTGGGAISFNALSDDDLIPIYTQNYTCIIDTATHQAIGKTEIETSYSSANGRISGKFEGLHLGKQMQIIWDGDIKNVRLVPRWWTI